MFLVIQAIKEGIVWHLFKQSLGDKAGHFAVIQAMHQGVLVVIQAISCSYSGDKQGNSCGYSGDLMQLFRR